jgi:hypothetical protein
VNEAAELLEAVASFVRRFVVLSDAQVAAVALWITHTHAFDAADATPYLSVTSAEKESGKTRLLETLELLVARPWLTGRVTAAVLARKVDTVKPTLLLDESDASFNGEKEYAETLRGMLNTGHRRGGRSSLCTGQGANLTYTDLSTFCPKAIAGIGDLPDTVASRSLAIRLKRKAPDEAAERFRRREAEEVAEPLFRWLVSWTEHHVDELAVARPELPEEQLSDRACDCWEPLFAIADLAGEGWPERARLAAVELAAGGRENGDSIRIRLLADVRTVFEERSTHELTTAELLEALAEIEEAPWGEWGRERRPLSAKGLASLLRPLEIKPRKWRDDSEKTVRGYPRERFEDAWTRYLPAYPPQPPQLSIHAESEASVSATEEGLWRMKKCRFAGMFRIWRMRTLRGLPPRRWTNCASITRGWRDPRAAHRRRARRRARPAPRCRNRRQARKR